VLQCENWSLSDRVYYLFNRRSIRRKEIYDKIWWWW
jgi:hypothetical protein